MKLSVSTLFCPEYSLDEVINLLKSNDINAVELRMVNGSWTGVESEADWEKFSDKLKKENITVTDVATSVTVKGFNNKDKELDGYREAFRFSKAFNAKGIRIFAGNWVKNIPEQPLDLNYEEIVERIKFLCDEAAKDNLEIWLESHNYEFSSGASLKKLSDDVKKDNFKIIWDILHSLEAGESIEETINYIGDIISHIHYKDAIPFEDKKAFLWKHTILGEGNVPIKEVAKSLERKNYDGYYSLEWEGNGKAELKDLKLSPENVLKKYIEVIRREEEDL